MTLRQSRARAFAAAAAVLVASAAAGKDESTHDARCPWGRVADGKGKLVRCITQREAAWLLLKKSYGDPKTATAPAGAARATVSGADGGVAKAPPAEKKKDKGDDDGEGSSTTDESVEAPEDVPIGVSVGPVTVDEGELPKAVSKLSIPKERYAACVKKHGGMFRDEGLLHVRFLVRQRGRAEGVHIVKRRSVTEAAGKCVADVVDRRLVGRPSAEMVGATLVVEFRKAKK